MIRIDSTERITEIALVSTELRLLGFSEHGIKTTLAYFDMPKGMENIYNMIAKYKQASDLYGDAQE